LGHCGEIVDLIAKVSGSCFGGKVLDKEVLGTFNILRDEGSLGLFDVVGKLFSEPVYNLLGLLLISLG
jgi:hypothetical protein